MKHRPVDFQGASEDLGLAWCCSLRPPSSVMDRFFAIGIVGNLSQNFQNPSSQEATLHFHRNDNMAEAGFRKSSS